ncbi:hypothetical protein G6F22_017664 [Rhizopus arrhizus]|nr:hypothetical protein G6F22_017664 [Rhizopus arrhizus]
MHPRVFLDVARTGSASCAYCGAEYRLKAGTVLHGHHYAAAQRLPATRSHVCHPRRSRTRVLRSPGTGGHRPPDAGVGRRRGSRLHPPGRTAHRRPLGGERILAAGAGQWPAARPPAAPAGHAQHDVRGARAGGAGGGAHAGRHAVRKLLRHEHLPQGPHRLAHGHAPFVTGAHGSRGARFARRTRHAALNRVDF